MNTENNLKTYLQAIREGITETMEEDGDVVFIGEDIGKYGGAFGVSYGLLNKFGAKRVIDTPISENSFVGLTTGAALTGLKPIVEIMFMDFITLAMDQIVNHMTKFHYMYGGQAKVPVVIRTAGGGGRGYGASHSQSLDSWFMHVPGLRIAVPSDPHDAKWLLKSAIDDPNPWLFIESKKLYASKGHVGNTIGEPVGKAKIVCEGADCTIVSYSRMTAECLKTAELLRGRGIKPEIIDLRTLYPLDMETIFKSLSKTRCLIIVEEGCKTGGVGAEISARVFEECFEVISRPVLRIACPDTPIPTSFHLEDFILPGADSIMKKIEAHLQ